MQRISKRARLDRIFFLLNQFKNYLMICMLGLDTQKLSITNYREATDSRQELANAPLYDIKGISFLYALLDPF